MRLFHLLVLPLFILNVAFAFEEVITDTDPQNGINYDQTFGGANDEFEFERFDNESVLIAIRKDMEIACGKEGLCTLSAVSSNDRRFTVQFYIGQGNNMNGMNTGNGTTVIVPGNNGSIYGNGGFYGVNLKFTTGRCTQAIKVPRSLYISINRYLYSLMSDDGGTRRGFTPADEAMIMFYSTIMKQATGCVAN
jgi:hypothetical protein